MDLPQCRIDRFQSLAVSLPEMYWNSLGVSQAPWNQMQGPLDPWHNLDEGRIGLLLRTGLALFGDFFIVTTKEVTIFKKNSSQLM
jgi:hypothetical protein